MTKGLDGLLWVINIKQQTHPGAFMNLQEEVCRGRKDWQLLKPSFSSKDLE